MERTSCFIASKERKTFKVHFRSVDTHSKDPQLAKSASIFLDGNKVSELIFRNDGSAYTRSGCQTSLAQLRLFQFARLVTTDGAHDNPHVSSELGSIRVHVASIKILNQSAKPKVYEVPDNMDGPVDEKSKKAQTHRTGLADQVQKWTGFCLIEKVRLPEHDFVFNYGPIDWLQAREIAPRTPLPPNKPFTKSEKTPKPEIQPKRETSPDILRSRDESVGGYIIQDQPSNTVKAESSTLEEYLDPDDLAVFERLKAKAQSRKQARPIKAEQIEVPPELRTSDAVIDLT